MKIVNKLLEVEKIKRYADKIERNVIPILRDELGLNVRREQFTDDDYHIKYKGLYNEHAPVYIEFLTSSRLDSDYPVFAYMTLNYDRRPVGGIDVNNPEDCRDVFQIALEDYKNDYDLEQSEDDLPATIYSVKGPTEHAPYQINGENHSGYTDGKYIFDVKGNYVARVGGKDKNGNEVILGKYVS